MNDDWLRCAELREKGDPYWIDVLPAGEFLELADKTVLHSGPPITFARMCRGHRRSMVNACLFEGWAKTEGEALRLLESGAVKCEAACDYATDGSGYGIITKSVPLLIVEDRDYGSRAGLFPSEGRFGGGFCGWGVYTEEIAGNLVWLRDRLFRELVAVLRDVGGFPLRDLFAEARRMGDELHSCQKAIDPLFTRAIVPYALKCGNAAELLGYFATADRFTHNFGQAASRALLLGLEREATGVRRGDAPETGGARRGSASETFATRPRVAQSFLTAAGGNGVDYGIKVAGSDTWFTAPAPMIEGRYLVPGAKRENQLPWIGDSSITECRGWGGQIRPVNPDFRREGAPETGEAQGEDALPTAGRAKPCGQGVPSLAEGLVINGGMMDVNGGWMGAGSTRIPQACFDQARAAGVLDAGKSDEV